MKSEAAVGYVPRILVVDDEPSVREGLETLLKDHGAAVETSASLQDAVNRNGRQPFDLVFVDGALSDADRVGGFAALRDGDNPPDVVILSAFDNGSRPADVLREGAQDIIAKPIQLDRIVAVTERSLENRRLRNQVEQLQDRVRELTSTELVGQSSIIYALNARIDQVAANDSTVLIHGERGVGKELVARCIHDRSDRSDGLFLTINCAALNENQLEAELFGFEPGAFAGIGQGRDGLIAEADGGVLVLDEICEMPVTLQAKLLRVLQEKSFRRVGGLKDRPARARIIAATSRDLGDEVKNGNFRQDLFYRLQVVAIHVAPLRERADDIALLSHYYLARLGAQMGKSLSGFTEEAMETLCEHSWPGNVRELRNAIEFAAISCPGGMIEESHLPQWNGGVPGGRDMIPRDTFDLPPGDRSLRSMEKLLVARVLDETNWNISRSASRLGINRTTLYNKIKLYKLGSRPSKDRIQV